MAKQKGKSHCENIRLSLELCTLEWLTIAQLLTWTFQG